MKVSSAAGAPLAVLALAALVAADGPHAKPDLVARSPDLASHHSHARMRLLHKRQLGLGNLIDGLTGGGGAGAADSASSAAAAGAASATLTSAAAANTAASVSAGAATNQQQTSAAAAVSSSAAATTSVAANTVESTPQAQATSSSSQAAASSAAQTSATRAAAEASSEVSSSAAAATASSATSSQVRASASSQAQQSTLTVESVASGGSSVASSASSGSSSSSASSASASDAALNSNGGNSSSSGGLPKPALIAIIVVGSVVVGALAIWTVIRKTALSPSKRFEKRLRSELDYSPNPTDPDLNNHGFNYDPDDAHLVPGTLAHARNISGMSDERPYGMAGQGVAPGYAPSLARSDSGKNSLNGSPPLMTEGMHGVPVMPYGGGPQYVPQSYYGAPTSPPVGPGYPQEQPYAFGELQRAGSSASLRPTSPAMQIPYQVSPGQVVYEQPGLHRMPSINNLGVPSAGIDYGVPYRPDSRSQMHY